jgi:hypothetical protein
MAVLAIAARMEGVPVALAGQMEAAGRAARISVVMAAAARAFFRLAVTGQPQGAAAKRIPV